MAPQHIMPRKPAGNTVRKSYYIEHSDHRAGVFLHFLRRTTAGNQYDIWQQWAGDAGTTFRTITIPLDLKAIASGADVHMGIKGKGAIVLSKYTIYSGTDEASVVPVTNGTPASDASGRSPQRPGHQR